MTNSHLRDNPSDEGQGATEKRKSPRVPAFYAITFEYFVGPHKIGQGLAESTNISGRGISFDTIQHLEPNDTVILWLTSPRYTLHARGVVIHSARTAKGRYRVGIRLDELLEGDWKFLEMDVARLQDDKDRYPGMQA